jgi:hypothetical protein
VVAEIGYPVIYAIVVLTITTEPDRIRTAHLISIL